MEKTITLGLGGTVSIGLFILLTLLFLAYAIVEVYNLHRQIEVKDAKISNLSYDLKNVKDHNSELKGELRAIDHRQDKIIEMNDKILGQIVKALDDSNKLDKGESK